MRLFIAIDVNMDIRKNLLQKVKIFQPFIKQGNWVKNDNIHLTIHFLGETPVEVLESLSVKTREVVGNIPVFKFTVHGFGIFEKHDKPAILWAGIIEKTGILFNLHNDLARMLTELNFFVDSRKFSPHITLCRIKSCDSFSLRKEVERLRDVDLGWVDVKKINLMKSTLSPAGAIYEVVKEFPLKERF